MVIKLPYSRFSFQRGQVILVILLILSVILVVGLAVVSRSVTDVKISQQSQEATRALWVAQAGLEQAIKANAGIGGTLNEVAYSVAKEDLGGQSNNFVFPGKFSSGDSQTLWLVDHNSDGTINFNPKGISRLTLFWGQSTSDKTALEATLLYKTSEGKYYFKRYAYAPSELTSSTYFAQATSPCSLNEVTFTYCSDNFSLPSGSVPIFLKIKLLFNSFPQPVGVSANASLPNQGACYESTATVTESGITRKLQQCQLWETTPPIFDYVLFSGGSLQ